MGIPAEYIGPMFLALGFLLLLSLTGMSAVALFIVYRRCKKRYWRNGSYDLSNETSKNEDEVTCSSAPIPDNSILVVNY